MYTVDTWFERDRGSIVVYQGNYKEQADCPVIWECWDDQIQELIEDGFLNPDNFKQSAIDYCKYLGLIK